MTSKTANGGAPKPCMGYPSRSAAVRALRDQGLSNRQISERTGIPRSSVGALAPLKQPEPVEIKPPRQIGFKLGTNSHLSVSVNLEVRRLLRPYAAKRGMSLELLITDLVEKIAEDGLADAVMDDGVK